MSDYTWYDVNPLNSIANIRQNHWTMNKGQRHSRLYGCSAAAALKGICYLTKYKLSAHTFVSPSPDSRRAVVSNWRKNVQEVLVNHNSALKPFGCLPWKKLENTLSLLYTYDHINRYSPKEFPPKLFSFENFKGAQLRPKTFWEKTGKYVVTSFLNPPPHTHTHKFYL